VQAFDRSTFELAELFATQAAALLEYAEQVEQLSEALHTRTDIGTAVGIRGPWPSADRAPLLPSWLPVWMRPRTRGAALRAVAVSVPGDQHLSGLAIKDVTIAGRPSGGGRASRRFRAALSREVEFGQGGAAVSHREGVTPLPRSFIAARRPRLRPFRTLSGSTQNRIRPSCGPNVVASAGEPKQARPSGSPKQRPESRAARSSSPHPPRSAASRQSVRRETTPRRLDR
jgi:hypothetical protein